MQIAICLIILAAAVALFVTEKLPAGVTALCVAVLLALTGVLTPAEAFAGFVDNSVLLFVGMFVVGGALFETGVAYQLASYATPLARTPRGLIVWVFLFGGVFSAFMPNLGTVAVLMPVVIALADETGLARSKLLLPLCFGANIGGNLTLLGTTGNVVAKSLLEQHAGVTIGFFDFTKYGLPMLIITALYYWLIGWRFLPDRPSRTGTPSPKADFSQVPAWKNVLSLLAMGVIVLRMVLNAGPPLPLTVAAAALFLVAAGVISEEAALRAINWRAVFLIAGMMSMAAALSVTGTGELIATGISRLLGDGTSPVAITISIWLLGNIISHFMASTAAFMLLAPICLSIAQQVGASPAALMFALIAGGTCVNCTPFAAGTNSMIFESGGYFFLDYVKNGLPLTLVCFVSSVLFLCVFFPAY